MFRRPAVGWSLLALALLALVIVPFLAFERQVSELTDVFLHADAPAGRPLVAAFVLLALALDVFAPVPSSFFATASGAFLGMVPGALCAWIGMQAGALLGYGFGRSAGLGAARRLVGEAALDRASQSHRRWGKLSVIAARAVPVLAESSVVLAGALRMPLFQFAWLAGLSNAAVAAVYAAIGAFALRTSAFLTAFAAAVLLPGALMLAESRIRNWRSAQEGRGPEAARAEGTRTR